MRIDLNVTAVNQVAPERETKQVKAGQPGNTHVQQTAPAPAQSEDTATLSSDALQRSSLASKALKLPEVRSAKVDAVSQALRSGQYELNPSKIADAIVADRVG